MFDKKVREKPCLRCEVPLRDVNSRHCPSCGLAVWLSMSGNDGLEASNPGWMRRMQRASFVLIAAAAATFLSLIMIRLAPETSLVLQAGCYLLSASLILHHIGMVALCAYERRHPDRMRGVRIAAIVIAIIGISCAIPTAMAAASNHSANQSTRLTATSPADDDHERPPARAYRQHTQLEIVPTFEAIAIVASTIVIWGWNRSLARRGQSHSVGRWCSWLLTGPLLALFFIAPLLRAVLPQGAWQATFILSLF
jgi:hypothetical protein